MSTYTSESPPHPQGQITGQVYPNIDVIRVQMKTPANMTPFYLDTDKDATQLYSWQQDNLAYVLKSDQETSSRRRVGGGITSAVHNKVLVSLNRLPMPPAVMELYVRLCRAETDTKEMRRLLLSRRLQFVGTVKAQWTFNPEEGGHATQNLRAIKVRGVSQVPLHYGAVGFNDGVEVVPPVHEEFRAGDYFGRFAGRRMEKDKLMLTVRAVNARRTREMLASSMRSYFLGGSELNTILQQSSERDKELLAPFALPEYLKRVVKVSMILGQHLGIAAGVLRVRDAPVGVDAAGNETYSSSLENGTPEEEGYAAYNYADALHFVKNNAQTISFPQPGATPSDGVRVLGSASADGREKPDLESAMEYLVAAMQLGDLTIPQPAPMASGADMLENEGMYASLAGRDGNNVIGRATEAFNGMMDAGCRMLIANMCRGQDKLRNTPGFDPDTQRNDTVMTRNGRDVSVDWHRDAGAAANTVMMALPAYLNVSAQAAHDMTQRQGSVIGPNQKGGVVNVYFG